MRIEVGTLREIGAKVGDVVEDKNHFNEHGSFNVLEVIEYGSFEGAHRMENESYGYGVFTDEDSDGWRIVGSSSQGSRMADVNTPITDRHMLHYVNGSLSAIEDMSMDRMKAAIVKLREEIKKHLGVE